MSSGKKLIVVVGPTASGKSDLAVELALKYQTEIVSADSRQFFREMRIGTAVPSSQQLKAVKHHLIQNRSVTEDYTAGMFEKDGLQIIEQIFETHNHAILVGGSGLYINAICNGFDSIPPTPPEIREAIGKKLETGGLESLLLQLKEQDFDYYNKVDRSNHKRVVRALEVIATTGQKYSTLRSGDKKKRDFEIETILIEMPRETLYQRINLRVDLMMEEGLEEEAKSLYHLRHLNALHTVGYSELFDYFDGKISKEEAIELIKRNSRRYAKRQITWFNRQQPNKTEER